MIPIAVSLDLTLPTFAGQPGLRTTPKAGVSFYGNWYDTVRSLVLDHAAKLAPGTSLVLTDPLADDRAGAALFGRFRDLATRRGARLLPVRLDIAPEENLRRLQTPSRAEHRKLTRPDVLLHIRNRYELLGPQGAEVMTLDATHLSAEDAAARILERMGPA